MTPVNGIKCVSLIDRMNNHIQNQTPWFSVEFFPPKTSSGAEDLISMFDHFLPSKPLYYAMVWRAEDNPACLTNERSPMALANAMINYCGLDTLLHMTCFGETKDKIRRYLTVAKEIGVKNLLLVRGDHAYGSSWEEDTGDFENVAQFVKFVREEFGTYFVIAVAGHPSGTALSSYQKCISILKEKVDAGADFVISQIFFDASVFIKFVRDCRIAGIKCPIIPTIFPISSYDSFHTISKALEIKIPDSVVQKLEAIHHDDEAVLKYGIAEATNLCETLLKSGIVFGFNFSTLNRKTAVTSILKNLGLWSSAPQRILPWRKSAHLARASENVRPIFWSIRPKSYFHRTADWEQFPNGRWGNPSAASFRDINDHYLFYLRLNASKQSLLDQWGHELHSEKDVWNVFSCFISGKPNSQGHVVENFPWCDEKLSDETNVIKEELIELNENGILTVNSQPNVNGESSTHPIFGWGPPNGYVYQKAYLEFFISKRVIGSLLTILRQYPNVSYHILNRSGDDEKTNHVDDRTIAVTWGVFPGREIVQPTIVDTLSFKIWKDEAYALWIERWAKLYPKQSESYALIEHIVDSYYLVNIIDNDFVKPNCLFKLLKEVLVYESREYNTNQVFAV